MSDREDTHKEENFHYKYYWQKFTRKRKMWLTTNVKIINICCTLVKTFILTCNSDQKLIIYEFFALWPKICLIKYEVKQQVINTLLFNIYSIIQYNFDIITNVSYTKLYINILNFKIVFFKIIYISLLSVNHLIKIPLIFIQCCLQTIRFFCLLIIIVQRTR